MKRLCMSCLMVLLVFGLIGCAGQEMAEERRRGLKWAGESGKVDVTFSITPDKAPGKIFLAGNFQGWNPKDSSYALADEDGDGTWEITIQLAPGTLSI